MKKMVRGHDIHDNWYKPPPNEKDGDTGSEDDEAKHCHDHRHEVEVRVAH